MEELALYGSPLEQPPLRLLELVESRRQQSAQRRGHLDVSAVAREREHLRDEERVAARSAHDPLADIVRDGRADELPGLLRGKRLKPERRRPAWTAIEQLGPGHADEQQRRAGREQRGRLDEVEKRLLSPLDVVEANNQWRLLLEQLPERPGDLVGAGNRLALPEKRPDCIRPGLVARQRIELLHHLDDGPVGDALAVGETAAAHYLCVDLRERLRHEPRLADAGIPDHSDHLAAGAGQRAVTGVHKLLQLPLAPDEARGVRALRDFADGKERVGGNRLALAPQL